MTIHETKWARSAMRFIALAFMKIAGWQVAGERPNMAKCVVIAAPHTSNWDFVFTVCIVLIFKIKASIMMKKAWFFWPMGSFFRWLGAVPIDRGKSNNLVSQMIEEFERRDELALIVAPSGTRKKTTYWKTGFYHIANGAGVPIVMGFLDYRGKRGGIGPALRPSGTIEDDMVEIRKFYSGIEGRKTEKMIASQRDAEAGASGS